MSGQLGDSVESPEFGESRSDRSAADVTSEGLGPELLMALRSEDTDRVGRIVRPVVVKSFVALSIAGVVGYPATLMTKRAALTNDSSVTPWLAGLLGTVTFFAACLYILAVVVHALWRLARVNSADPFGAASGRPEDRGSSGE